MSTPNTHKQPPTTIIGDGLGRKKNSHCMDLLQTFAGCPSTALQHLVLTRQTLLLYPSANSVVVLNAHTLALVRVLAFWEVFPGTFHSKDTVNCVSVDLGMKLIVASMDTRIAVWSLSGAQDDTWRIHSSLILPDGHTVTTLDSKSGLLAVGSRCGLSVYTLILENDLPTWSKKWASNIITPCLARFAPSLMYIAITSHNDHAVKTYSTTSGHQTQVIQHPRPVTNLTWRQPQASSRDDLVLYTITSDATLRIFLPVLDSPQYLQLHASLDLFSSLPVSVTAGYSKASPSTVFWLDRQVIGDALTNVLKNQSDQEDARSRRVREIKEEGWDLFLRVLADGSVLITAVANVDRRPPTLLKHFTLQQSLPSTLSKPPTYLYLLPNPSLASITLVVSPPLETFSIDIPAFFDAHSDGLRIIAQGLEWAREEESKIVRFVKTPEGKGVGVLRSDCGEAWRVVERGSKLVRTAKYPATDHIVILDHGKNLATYSSSDGILTLHSTPPAILSLPSIIALFSLPSHNDYEFIVGISNDLSVVLVHIADMRSLAIQSHNSLPLVCPPKMILPVDPMAWSGGKSSVEDAVLLSLSEEGELAFWAPEVGLSPQWRCTGKVQTRRKGLRMAKCSSTKKSALIVPVPEGEELTIWDSKESEFASGLEFHQVFNESELINDLDWTSTPDNQSILAVGFPHHVELLCQQRMTYFDEGPGWAICWKIDIGNLIPFPIADSVWLTNGSLLIGAGHQMCLFGQPRPSLEDGSSSTSTESLFEQVARQNGPLEDYHPQMLLQCLLWDKVELVKEIIVNLACNVEDGQEGDMCKKKRQDVPVESFLRKDQTIQSIRGNITAYSSLFSGPEPKNESDQTGFTRSLVLGLIETLECRPLPHLTPNEQAHLLVLIQTTLEIDEQRRALDANGLRYLISMRSFYILNHRSSASSSPQSKGVIPRRQTGRRERLRYRDMIWAFHSESQDLLLNASTVACNGKMCWSDARALGVSIWLRSVDAMKTHIEVISRNEYMAGDNRDPSACSLFYFALGKVKLVHGLWRQAAWHKEQAVMLKFLSNDFSEPRWRTAALKNAYVLLSKQRFEYAAAFFILGGSLKDAVSVCVKQLSDFQLAVALARVVEQSNNGPVLCDILNNTVLPIAFKNGNRWLGSWAFWLLNRKDLAVRILLTPLQEIAGAFDVQVKDIRESLYDDPSLALLFSQLKSKTLQTAKGTSEISGRAEFNFVLQMARVFCRMGCHVLALDLVRSWSFERPSTAGREALDTLPSTSYEGLAPLSPTVSRRSMFTLKPALRRRASIMIDMEIPSLPSTRAVSPERRSSQLPQGLINDDGDLMARKAGLGSLMKSAKQDVKVPEFDIGAFL